HDQVQTAVADAVGYPGLQLWFPLPDGNGYVQADGRVRAGLPTADRVTTPVLNRGGLLAVLVHDSALRDQGPLIDAVVAAARLALDNARLLAAQRAQLDEVRASRARIVVAADAERRRIQRDLHDGVQHKLLLVSMLMEQAREDVV